MIPMAATSVVPSSAAMRSGRRERGVPPRGRGGARGFDGLVAEGHDQGGGGVRVLKLFEHLFAVPAHRGRVAHRAAGLLQGR